MKYYIHISYSWGDRESPVEYEAESEYDAFMYMIDLAAKEAQVSMELNDELTEMNPTNIKIIPSERKIILHYGNDDEECYYTLNDTEEEDENEE